uniref:F-box only protein 9 n=1 Tax=Timema tahoe TaxID=61484 RepID=A0A7R9IMT8_9NEOP|nr:unnamed protein product [Timema tahoe]
MAAVLNAKKYFGSISNNQYQHASAPTPVSSVVGVGSTDGGTSGVGHDSGGDGVEGEEQEESSSSSHGTGERPKVDDELTIFREQWQRELETAMPDQKQRSATSLWKDASNREDKGSNKENEAKYLFLKGVENEQNGTLYEAIQFYRRAVQLVPDIEFRLYDASKPKPRDRQDTESTEDGLETATERDVNAYSDDDDDEGEDLLSRLQRFFSRSCSLCVPQHEQTMTHISSLPMEIVLYILRWVVSADLDIRSLELCSRVSRGFYLCSRDSEIWRLACISRGVRFRLHFNGCYICKTTYIRHGENSFQDQFYRPWHLVEYYRYLRFFPEGVVLMLTTPDDPITSLAHLRQRTPRNPAVLTGHYRLHEDRVIMVLKKHGTQGKISGNNRYRARHNRETSSDLEEQNYHLELQINSYRNRLHSQLAWQGYSIFMKLRNGAESTSKFELPTNRYPPFWFSRVKSYTAESENPLQ